MPTPPPTIATLSTADSHSPHLRERPCEGARGTVLIVHGLGEHIGRYEHVAAHLVGGGRRVVGNDRITPWLARFIVDAGAGAGVLAQAPRWRLPTLLLYAGADRCVAPAGVVTTQVFPAFFHELFNEPEKAEAFAAMTAWLARQN